MKRYISILSILSLIFFLLNSCSTTNDSEELIIRSSSVSEIINIDNSFQNISFLVKAWWSNSCGRLHHADIVKSGESYKIKVYGFQKKEEYCATVITKFEAKVNINVQNPGQYTFQFWESDNSTVDTTITIE